MAQTIGFIGLGNMGGPMAANLVKAGHTVRGFDLVPASLEAARAEGITVAGSALAAAEGADVVITMLPAGRHVVEVWTQLAAALPAGTLLIDSSTVDVESARKAHALAEAQGCLSVDAPVSGGTGGAKAGTLTFMAGGAEAAFAKAEPLLKAMGKNVFHCGDAGAGQAAKICNNMILGISMIGVSEAFALGEKLGLSREVAGQLARQTALGAAQMANTSDVDPAELRRRVTSPKGTTEAAITTFQANGFEALVEKAVGAADHRSAELAEQLGQ